MEPYTAKYLLRIYALAAQYDFEPVSLVDMGRGFNRGDRRAQAAVRELVAGGLLERHDSHGFTVTNAGRRLAQELRERSTTVS